MENPCNKKDGEIFWEPLLILKNILPSLSELNSVFKQKDILIH
jgi:hypothetical protein